MQENYVGFMQKPSGKAHFKAWKTQKSWFFQKNQIVPLTVKIFLKYIFLQNFIIFCFLCFYMFFHDFQVYF